MQHTSCGAAVALSTQNELGNGACSECGQDTLLEVQSEEEERSGLSGIT